MEDFRELIIWVTGIALVSWFIGVSYQREQAQWQDAMDFAKRTGGHYESDVYTSRIVYPDGRVLLLSGGP